MPDRHTVGLMTERHEHDVFVTAQVAAEILQVNLRTVDRYEKRGLLPRYETAGGRPRYRLEDVELLRTPRPAGAWTTEAASH